jgi:hypothetical protein
VKPPVPTAAAQCKPFRPKTPRKLGKPPGKDEMLARKNAAVLAERERQKDLCEPLRLPRPRGVRK